METLHLEIVTPNGLIFSNDVKSVVLPGKEGEFGVLPRHASLVSLLNAGVVDIELSSGNHEIVAVDWGYAEVTENKVDVLVDGPFNEDLKDISLRFRGSSNQRIIDVKESMKNKSLVLFLKSVSTLIL